MIEASVYLFFCILTGVCGSQRRMGFLGTFALSVVLTPLVMLPILILTGPSHTVEWRHHPHVD